MSNKLVNDIIQSFEFKGFDKLPRTQASLDVDHQRWKQSYTETMGL